MENNNYQIEPSFLSFKLLFSVINNKFWQVSNSIQAKRIETMDFGSFWTLYLHNVSVLTPKIWSISHSQMKEKSVIVLLTTFAIRILFGKIVHVWTGNRVATIFSFDHAVSAILRSNYSNMYIYRISPLPSFTFEADNTLHSFCSASSQDKFTQESRSFSCAK